MKAYPLQVLSANAHPSKLEIMFDRHSLVYFKLPLWLDTTGTLDGLKWTRKLLSQRTRKPRHRLSNAISDASLQSTLNAFSFKLHIERINEGQLQSQVSWILGIAGGRYEGIYILHIWLLGSVHQPHRIHLSTIPSLKIGGLKFHCHDYSRNRPTHRFALLPHPLLTLRLQHN